MIEVDNISKVYRIGLKEAAPKNFGDLILAVAKSPLKNFQKYRSLYKFHESELDSTASRANDDIIWALKEVSFEVKKGEIVGIIGRNGAGKSTLLKILSKITEPTFGCARLKGRVSSLLEVGTGFHPELTGRENVYLNGTILGMRKREVDRKFDEIIDFSGIGKFIDTPIKRYSSGMTVRLAFSVAAHLEPEILLIDEVLAVGDAAFQKKCLNKMNKVAKTGRTVLFVSHNMASIENLCSRAILLQNGIKIKEGQTKTVIDFYLSSVSESSKTAIGKRTDRKGKGEVLITDLVFLNGKGDPIEFAVTGKELKIRLFYKVIPNETLKNCRISVAIFKDDRPFINLSTELVEDRRLDLKETGYLDFIVPEFPLSRGNYLLTTFVETNKEIQDWVLDAADLPVIDGDFYGTGRNYPKGWDGKTVLVKHKWSLGECILP